LLPLPLLPLAGPDLWLVVAGWPKWQLSPRYLVVDLPLGCHSPAALAPSTQKVIESSSKCGCQPAVSQSFLLADFHHKSAVETKNLLKTTRSARRWQWRLSAEKTTKTAGPAAITFPPFSPNSFAPWPLSDPRANFFLS
jgi:hypothetical protein